MSIRVHKRLRILFIETTNEERQEIDREIERRTKVYCDTGIDRLSDEELRQIVADIRRKKKKVEEIYA